MITIIDYAIATGNDHKELVWIVTDQIREGWQPYNPIFQTVQHDTLFIHQAMVKYDTNKNTMSANKSFLRDYKGDVLYHVEVISETKNIIHEIHVFCKDSEQKPISPAYLVHPFTNDQPNSLNKAIEDVKKLIDAAQLELKTILPDNASEQKCRVCGCTENNCEQCIKLTGHPCHWVEVDLCSACQDAIDTVKNQSSNKNLIDMNFFEQLAASGNVDLTMRIMQKNDKLTLNIMPGSNSSTFKPILITGTAAELDAEFFSTVIPGVNEVKGLITNLDAVKKNPKLDKSEDNDDEEQDTTSGSSTPAPKKAVKKSAPKKAEKPTVKKEKKPAEKKEPVKPESALFPGV